MNNDKTKLELANLTEGKTWKVGAVYDTADEAAAWLNRYPMAGAGEAFVLTLTDGKFQCFQLM